MKNLFIPALALVLVSCGSDTKENEYGTTTTTEPKEFKLPAEKAPEVVKEKPVVDNFLEDMEDSISYAFGVNMGYSMKFKKVDINEAAFNEAVSRSFSGRSHKIKPTAARQFEVNYFSSGRYKTDKNTPGETASLNNSIDSISYVLGANMGEKLRSVEKNIDQEMWRRGFDSTFYDGEVIFNDRVATNFISDYQDYKIQKERMAFLDNNAKKPGVVKLPSGLQYKILTEGDGPKPTTSDRVKVHYHGTLTDGTVFDSSVDRGQPATFGVTQVIKGWTEALQLMPVGSKWRLYIPEYLAYGERAQNKIPAYSTLIFDVELLGIE